MSKCEFLTVLDNVKLSSNVYKMYLCGDISAITAPGQFVNIKLDGAFLRRPISVCDVNGNVLTIVYKVVGSGTKKMSSLSRGDRLDTIIGLGNGYDISKAGVHPLLIGGGVGVPPLFYLARHLIANGAKPTIVLGFNTADDAILYEEFAALGLEVILATADGSLGSRGFVTDVMPNADYTYVFTCGPEQMLKAIYNKTDVSGQYSFEERMGCGFGACMGCTCKTKYGHKRICKDGPVLEKEEIVW